MIINTDGRAAILGNTLECLRYLRYPRLEVVVVPGPTADGTRELLRSWQPEVRVGYCPARNIAQSRNIGIEISSGELIAYIDDDMFPEPEWLEDLVPLLDDPAVAVAGGWLHDHTGKGYETRFETTDRLGNKNIAWERAVPEFNFPLSYTVPFLTINSVFRRSALVDIGGFDEEFEYLYDETDLMCRFVDRGWHVAQTDCGIVHHKYLPSAVRNEHRVLKSWYSSIKNKTYFALLHGRGFKSIDFILDDILKFVEGSRADMHRWVGRGVLPDDAPGRFAEEAERAVRDGMARALSGRRRLADPARLAGDARGFVAFRTHLPASRQHCFILLSADYRPAPIGESGRYVDDFARAAAAAGQQVHVLTVGAGHDRVDFEDGVWVHRCVLREFPPLPSRSAPREVWNHSMTMLAEAEEIGKRRPIAAVFAPLGNAPAIAFLGVREWPLVTRLDAQDPECDGKPAPLLAAELDLLSGSDGLLADGAAIVAAIAAAYRLDLDRDRLRIVPQGVEDWAGRSVEFLLEIAARRAGSAPTRQSAAD